MALELEGKRIEAVLLDVDGTLYLQPRLRMLVLTELAALPVAMRSLRGARHVVTVLRQFRRDRERLRESAGARAPLEQLQYEVTANRLHCSAAEVRAIVDEWIYRRPLRHLARCRRSGLQRFVDHLCDHAVRLGAFSDYPVDAKLHALGLGEACTLRLCATDGDIDAFKPNPRGFLRACERWQLPPRDVLYVGDRFEVDGLGAQSAGMRCAIIGSARGAMGEGVFGARTFEDLQRRLRVA